MKPGYLNYGEHPRGDTIDAKTFTLTTTSAGTTAPINLTGADVRMTFSLAGVKVAFTTGGGITLTDATAGIFRKDKFSLPHVGVWSFDLQVILNGDTKTYIIGQIEIIKDITA
jgi:hypothetical protein